MVRRYALPLQGDIAERVLKVVKCSDDLYSRIEGGIGWKLSQVDGSNPENLVEYGHTFFVPTGTEISNCATGVVLEAVGDDGVVPSKSYEENEHNYVTIQTPRGVKILYNNITPTVDVGDLVAQGATLGKVAEKSFPQCTVSFYEKTTATYVNVLRDIVGVPHHSDLVLSLEERENVLSDVQKYNQLGEKRRVARSMSIVLGGSSLPFAYLAVQVLNMEQTSTFSPPLIFAGAALIFVTSLYSSSLLLDESRRLQEESSDLERKIASSLEID